MAGAVCTKQGQLFHCRCITVHTTSNTCSLNKTQHGLWVNEKKNPALFSVPERINLCGHSSVLWAPVVVPLQTPAMETHLHCTDWFVCLQNKCVGSMPAGQPLCLLSVTTSCHFYLQSFITFIHLFSAVRLGVCHHCYFKRKLWLCRSWRRRCRTFLYGS